MKSRTANFSSDVLISRLLQLCVIVSILSVFLKYDLSKVQIVKYSVYISFLLFSFSIFAKIRMCETDIHKHYNLLVVNIFIYLLAITQILIEFSLATALLGGLGSQMLEGWASISIDCYRNILFCALFSIVLTILMIIYFLEAGKKFSFLTKSMGLNIMLIAAIWVLNRIIFFYENIF